MKWSLEKEIKLKNQDVYFIQASGTISQDDFEIDNLLAFWENGEERKLTQEEDEAIADYIDGIQDTLYEDAMGSSIDDAYDRWKDEN